MALPERKSHKLERSILKFKEDLAELQANHKVISDEILELTLKLLHAKVEEDFEIMEGLEDLSYEMNNNILLILEMTFESIGGFEIKIMDIGAALPYIIDEQELLKNLEMSAKNLVKTLSVKDDTLSNKERENLIYLFGSYKQITKNTQNYLLEISNELEKMFQKVKKMEKI